MTFKKHWLGSFAWRAIVCTTKVRMKLLELGKDMKIKHSVSSPKSIGRLFLKKSLHGGANSFGQIYGGCFTWRLMIRSCKGGGKVSQVHFPVIWTLQIWEFSPAMAEDTLEHKYLPVYRVMEEFIREING